MPFYPFLGEGSPTKIDYSKKGTLILTSLLEDLVTLDLGLLLLSARLFGEPWEDPCYALAPCKRAAPALRGCSGSWPRVPKTRNPA